MKNIILIDTHAHQNFSDFKSDSKEVIKRALDENIWMINGAYGDDFGKGDRRLPMNTIASLCGGWTASRHWDKMGYEEKETV